MILMIYYLSSAVTSEISSFDEDFVAIRSDDKEKQTSSTNKDTHTHKHIFIQQSEVHNDKNDFPLLT